MSRVVRRGLKRQLELRTPQQPIHEAVQSQEQPHFQTKGIQLVDAPSIESQ
jgi:hypothetical protein